MEDEHLLFDGDNGRERVPSRMSLIDGHTPRPLSRLSMPYTEAHSSKRSRLPRNSMVSEATAGDQGPNIYRADLEHKWKLESDDIRTSTLNCSSDVRTILGSLATEFKKRNDEAISNYRNLTKKISESDALIQKLTEAIACERPKLDKEKEKAEIIRGEMVEQNKEIASLEEKYRKLLIKEENLMEEFKRKTQNKELDKEKIEEQGRISRAETAAIEKALGLHIKKEGRDILSFTFSGISEKNPKEACRLVLDLSSGGYSIVECKPALPKTEEYIAQLNTSRDLVQFFALMRIGFQEHFRSSS